MPDTPMRRLTPSLLVLLNFAVAGALLVQPLAFLIWAAAEHGGRGLATFPWAGMCGAVLGIIVGLGFLAVRYLYRRVFGARTA